MGKVGRRVRGEGEGTDRMILGMRMGTGIGWEEEGMGSGHWKGEGNEVG